MAAFRLETFVAAPAGRVFDLARDLDAHVRSMDGTNERAIGGRTSGLMEAGEEVEWEARHLGFTWRMRVRIASMRRPFEFVDEQLRGPFRSFRHTHTFEAVDGGTRMIDDWQHAAPLGPLGWLADRLVLDRHMRRLLTSRAAALKREAETPAA